MGIELAGSESLNRQVLGRLGVPMEAIRVLDEGVQNTAEEVRLIVREMGRTGGSRVILVTLGRTADACGRPGERWWVTHRRQ